MDNDNDSFDGAFWGAMLGSSQGAGGFIAAVVIVGIVLFALAASSEHQGGDKRQAQTDAAIKAWAREMSIGVEGSSCRHEKVFSHCDVRLSDGTTARLVCGKDGCAKSDE